MTDNDVKIGVARTSIFVAGTRAIITNKYLELLSKKEEQQVQSTTTNTTPTTNNQDDINKTIISNHAKKLLEKGNHYLNLTEQANENLKCFNKKESCTIYDPYALFFLNTNDSLELLSETFKSIQKSKKKDVDNKDDNSDKEFEKFNEYIHSVPSLVAWSEFLSKSSILRMAFRTKYIDDIILENCCSGGGGEEQIKQIVIIGAGLDCRSKRLPIPIDCKVFEIDLPQVIEYKKSILESTANHYIEPLSKCDIYMIPADCTKNQWVQDIEKNGFNKSVKSLWILEGFVMYISENDLNNIFNNIKNLSATSSKLLVHTITKFEFEPSATLSPSNKRNPMDWSFIKDEFISRHENPISDILEKFEFSKNTSTKSYQDLMEFYDFKLPNFVKLNLTNFSIGTKN